VAVQPTAEDLQGVLTPVVEGAGLFLEEVRVVPSGKTFTVRVTVDLNESESGSVGLERIAEVSREISTALDEVSTLDNAYMLEVSSPGTNRPLTEPRHFRRALSRLIKISATSGDFTARLIRVGEDELEFEDGRRVALADIRKAKIEVELKRAEEAREEDLVDIVPEESDTQDVED